MLGGGDPVFDKVSKGGYQNFTETPRGVSILYTNTKKDTEQSKISLSRNSPAALDAPLARFASAALKSFQHPGRSGVPIFDSDSERGGGGMRFLRALFPKRTTPPLTRNS